MCKNLNCLSSSSWWLWKTSKFCMAVEGEPKNVLICCSLSLQCWVSLNRSWVLKWPNDCGLSVNTDGCVSCSDLLPCHLPNVWKAQSILISSKLTVCFLIWFCCLAVGCRRTEYYALFSGCATCPKNSKGPFPFSCTRLIFHSVSRRLWEEFQTGRLELELPRIRLQVSSRGVWRMINAVPFFQLSIRPALQPRELQAAGQRTNCLPNTDWNLIIEWGGRKRLLAMKDWFFFWEWIQMKVWRDEKWPSWIFWDNNNDKAKGDEKEEDR